MKRLALAILILLASAFAGTSTQTLADITGTGATVAICATCGVAKWVQLTTPSTNAAVVRWGDSNTSSTRGSLIAPGGGQGLRPQIECPCDLSATYVYVANSDKVSVTYGY